MIQHQIQNLTIIACVTLWGCALIAAIAWSIAATLMRFATRRLEETPVPYWPADSTIEALIPIVMCPMCRRDRRPGPCSCSADCGHPACMWAHVELSGLSEAEERFASGKGEMP